MDDTNILISRKDCAYVVITTQKQNEILKQEDPYPTFEVRQGLETPGLQLQY